MGDDELDQLYRAKPESFTALRTELAAAAKKSGDSDRAKVIASARKPTTAAWVVNTLAHKDSEAKERLSGLGARMRAAHAAMSGEKIRELSAEQRHLVDELTRAALASAELTDPPSALRDDVSGTLQAAIADPDVTARLGRLVKAERWSGFGEFGDTTPISSMSRSDEPGPSVRAKPKRSAADRRAERETAQAEVDRAQERAAQKARADVAAAEKAKADAQLALTDQEAQLASARERREQARKALHQADRDVSSAESAYEAAVNATHATAKAVREARARLKQR